MGNNIFLKFIKFTIDYLKWRYFLYSNSYDSDTLYYVLKYGIGDTYLVSTLLPHFRKHNNKIVLLVEKGNQSFIPLLFDNLVEVRQAVDIPYDLIAKFGRNYAGQPIVLHPDWIKNVNLVSLLGYKEFNLLDVYKLMLNLDLEVQPSVPKNSKSVAIELIDKLGLNKNTVLLCPQANSIATVDVNFWLKLAAFLSEEGFSPVFMNSSYSEEFATISFPLGESIALCNGIKGVVSLRSGFCDLISSCRAAKIILYPKIKWYSGSLMQGSSLQGMGLANDKLFELEFQDSDDNTTLFNQIKSFLNGQV